MHAGKGWPSRLMECRHSHSPHSAIPPPPLNHSGLVILFVLSQTLRPL